MGDYLVYLEPTEAMEHHQLTIIHVLAVCMNKNKHELLQAYRNLGVICYHNIIGSS